MGSFFPKRVQDESPSASLPSCLALPPLSSPDVHPPPEEEDLPHDPPLVLHHLPPSELRLPPLLLHDRVKTLFDTKCPRFKSLELEASTPADLDHTGGDGRHGHDRRGGLEAWASHQVNPRGKASGKEGSEAHHSLSFPFFCASPGNSWTMRGRSGIASSLGESLPLSITLQSTGLTCIHLSRVSGRARRCEFRVQLESRSPLESLTPHLLLSRQ